MSYLTQELLESASKLEISDKEEEKKSADEQTSLEDNIAVTTDKKEEDNLTIPVEVSVTEESSKYINNLKTSQYTKYKR